MTASKSKKNKYEIDMCNGTVLDKLISFSIPLMLSSILQLLFNAVDIVVVGRFSGSRALAAVGSTTALINVFTNLFIGVSLGANVLAARFYATKQEKQMSETVHTAVTFALISGIVMVFVLDFSFQKQPCAYGHSFRRHRPVRPLYADLFRRSPSLCSIITERQSACRRRYKTAFIFPYHRGNRKRSFKPLPRDRITPRSRGSCNRHSDRTDDLLSPCPSLSISLGRKLSTSIFRNDNQVDLFKANFSGRYSRRHTKYGYQLLKRTSSIFGKLFWFYRNGRLYSCK